MKPLHIKIREARKAAKLSQEAIGAACNPPISKAAVGLWETNDPEKRTQPKLDNLRTLAVLTGKDFSYFLDDEESLMANYEIRENFPTYESDNISLQAVTYVIENQLKDVYKHMTPAQQVEIIYHLFELLQDAALRDSIKSLQKATLYKFLGVK